MNDATFERLKDQLYNDDDPGLVRDFTTLRDIICSLDGKDCLKHWSRVLPVSLKLIDHHDFEAKGNGVQCVSHLIKNVDHNHIVNTGSDALFLDSLQKCLYFPDVCLVDAVLPVIHLILQNKSFSCSSPDVLDKIMDVIIRGIIMSTDKEAKTVYWKHMSSFISLQGLAFVRYSKQFMKLIEDQLSYPLMQVSQQLFLNVLQTISSFISATSPRIKIYSPQLLFSLMSFQHSNHDALEKQTTVRLMLRRVIVQIEYLDRETCDAVSKITCSPLLSRVTT